MAAFVSAREECRDKADFDYCMCNWKSLPDETSTAWSILERKPFRDSLNAAIKAVAEDDKWDPLSQEVPEPILAVLKDVSFHSITMLDVINKTDRITDCRRERLLAVSKMLAEYWMKSHYLTQILLSFVREPESVRKAVNTKNYYAVIFAMGEKLAEQNQFIQFMLTKVDTALRVLVERDDARILKDVFTNSIAVLIQRVFIRFCTGMYRAFEPASYEYLSDNPFVSFVSSAVQLCQRSYRIQRILGNIMLRINNTQAQEKIFSCWFSFASEIGSISTVPFYPISSFISDEAYQITLLKTIPFDSGSNHSIEFWKNWANYLTLDLNRIPVVWEQFTGHFWAFTSDVVEGDRLKTAAIAFATLALALKPKLTDLQKLVRVSTVMDNITRIMETADATLMHVGMAISHIIFDLARIQEEFKQEKVISSECIFDCDAEIFLLLIRIYEGKNPSVPLQLAEPDVAKTKVVDSEDEDDGQEKYYEGLDDRVQRLRGGGLTPTSLKDVFHILVGEKTGSNDSETEALKQVAVLSIPILMAAGGSADFYHVESIARILFEWGEDNDLDEFLIVALFELATAYPDIISNTLASLVFCNNYGFGEKCQMLKMAEKVLIYCGTNRCLKCFSMYAPYKKDEMRKLICRIEPAFLTKYLNRAQPVCVTCPKVSKLEATEESIRLQISNAKIESPSSDLAVTGSNSDSSVGRRGPPPTRRWGTKRQEEIVASKKKTFHTSLWAALNHQFAREAEFFLDDKSIQDSVRVHFLLELLQFLRLLIMTYTGLGCFALHFPKDALHLIQIYGCHPDTKVRRALWDLPKEIFENAAISSEVLVTEIEDESFHYFNFLSSALRKETNLQIQEIIIAIRKLFNWQKFKNLSN